MISCADQNDKWASYAGPGGWNGTKIFIFILFLHFYIHGKMHLNLLNFGSVEFRLSVFFFIFLKPIIEIFSNR